MLNHENGSARNSNTLQKNRGSCKSFVRRKYEDLYSSARIFCRYGNILIFQPLRQRMRIQDVEFQLNRMFLFSRWSSAGSLPFSPVRLHVGGPAQPYQHPGHHSQHVVSLFSQWPQLMLGARLPGGATVQKSSLASCRRLPLPVSPYLSSPARVGASSVTSCCRGGAATQ